VAHVLFDVNGTLLDLRALTEGWPGAPAGLGLTVLDQTVAQAMTDTMTGGFRPSTAAASRIDRSSARSASSRSCASVHRCRSPSAVS
jgi:hypothetical protein